MFQEIFVKFLRKIFKWSVICDFFIKKKGYKSEVDDEWDRLPFGNYEK